MPKDEAADRERRLAKLRVAVEVAEAEVSNASAEATRAEQAASSNTDPKKQRGLDEAMFAAKRRFQTAQEDAKHARNVLSRAGG